MKRSLFFAVGLLLPAPAHADCATLVPRSLAKLPGWAQALAPGRRLGATTPGCAIWPGDTALALAALPLAPQQPASASAPEDFLVAVLDAKSGAVVAHLLEPRAITDTFNLSYLVPDTARYQLTRATRAFGIRVGHEARYADNPAGATELYLYVIEGQTLRRVLKRLVVSVPRWDRNCAPTYEGLTRTVSIGPPGQDGYAALNIVEKTVCEGGKTRRSTVTLNYAAGAYPVPAALSN